MFPAARNSLRQWSDHYQSKIPIPTAVEVHNLMILTDKEQQQARQQNSQWFRPEHNARLLPKVQLEILVVTRDNGETLTVYSQICTNRIHPSFEHLDERIELDGEWWFPEQQQQQQQQQEEEEELQQNQEQSDWDVYKSMIMRFSVVSDEEDENGSSKNNVFLEVPIYPSLLHRLSETPQALPPNSCLVHFSDGSTRLPQNTFQVLLDRKLTTLPPIEDFSRFEDDVFRTLDSVPQTPERRRRSDSLLDQESITLFPQQLSKEPSYLGDVQPPIISFDECEQDVLDQDLQKEALSLQKLIALEEKALEEELVLLNEEKESMTKFLQETKEIEEQVELLKKETINHSNKLKQEEFAQQARKINLFRDLQSIYPISLDPQKGFLIRDLRLPVDIYTTSVPDDEISASLGFACHLIFMMSKYLHVGIRHRVFCNSSRSAVQQDGTAAVFPLFAARGVEREMLDSGLALLGENVDCMLMTFEIQFTPKSHILQRLKRIYDCIIHNKIRE